MAILIPLDRIDSNPWQTRQHYDEDHIRALADDIERNGVLQPALGRVTNAEGKPSHPTSCIDLDKQRWSTHPSDEARIQLALGHNRLRALRLLQSEGRAAHVHGRPVRSLPVQIRSMSDEEMARFAWAENQQRKDLTAVEEARAIEQRMTSFDWTQTQVAEHLGLDRSTVSNKLRLLRLPVEVQQAITEGHLTERTAMALLPLYGHGEPLASRLRNEKRNWEDQTLYEQTLEAALSGAPSDQVRRKVAFLLERSTEALGIVESLHDYGADGVAAMRQGTCKGCSFLLTVGDKKRCGDPLCLSEKTNRAAGLLLTAASEATGLPITTSADERKTTTFDRYGSGEKLAQRLLRKGCPSGRLHIRLADSYPGFCVPDHKQAELVCLHTSGGHCACKGSKASNQSAQQAAAAQETRIGRAQARLLGEERFATPAKEAIFQALLALNQRAWNVALKLIASGTNTSWSYDYSYEQGRKGFFTDVPADFEALCLRLADWAASIEVHHYNDCADSLAEVEQFIRRRMEAMGLSFDEPDYGAVDINLVCELATLPSGEAAFAVALERATLETLLDVERRLTNEKGKPLRGHKGRLEILQRHISEMESTGGSEGDLASPVCAQTLEPLVEAV